MFQKNKNSSLYKYNNDTKIKDCPMITSITINPLQSNQSIIKKLKANSIVKELKKSYQPLIQKNYTEENILTTTPNISIDLGSQTKNNKKQNTSANKNKFSSNKQNTQLNFSFNPLISTGNSSYNSAYSSTMQYNDSRIMRNSSKSSINSLSQSKKSLFGNFNVKNSFQKTQLTKNNSKTLLQNTYDSKYKYYGSLNKQNFNLFEKNNLQINNNIKKSKLVINNSQNLSQSNSKTYNDQSIRVSIRFRPINSQKNQISNQLRFLNDQIVLAQQKLFAFDKLFTKQNQKQIFEQTAKPIIDKLFQGFNGTIFAYGQTGSGKTHTIFGKIEDSNTEGLIPRSIHEIFIRKNQNPDNKFSISCSLVQIYKQGLIDLFNFKNQLENNKDNREPILKLKQNKQKGVYIQNLKTIQTKEKQQLMNYIIQALKNRRVSATKLNEKSSRSHTILTLNLFFQKFTTKFSLIDLAGSQKVRKSGVTGQNLEETKKINYSLSCLGNVINALTTRQNNDHIPFRDSKLTRILQDSLSGRFFTSIIVTCALEKDSYNQTISSLKFAQRVKKVKILPQNQMLINRINDSRGKQIDIHLADSIQIYQQKINQLVNELEKTKIELQNYKSSSSNLQKFQINNSKIPPSNNLSRIGETTQQMNFTGRSMAQQTEGDMTARLQIPSERAHVFQKFTKYTEKQIVPLFLGSKRQSSTKLQEQLNQAQMLSFNVSNTFYNMGSNINSGRQRNFKEQDIQFSQLSDHETSQNYTDKKQIKAPNRKIINLEDKQSQISFTFSIYKQEDFTSQRKSTKNISTKRSLR